MRVSAWGEGNRTYVGLGSRMLAWGDEGIQL